MHFRAIEIGVTKRHRNQILMMTMTTGSEAGISYSDPGIVEKRLIDIKSKIADRVTNLDIIAETTLQSQRRLGRMKTTSPVHSPFMRHKKKLELE
jgi:hypothetical protein